MKAILAGILLALLALSAAAGVINVPSEQTTIQAAIDAASPNDTILVSPGTYVENLLIDHKAICLLSTDGREVTTIIGDSAGLPVVQVLSERDIPTEVKGFAITNPAGGSGFYGYGDSTVLEGCEIYTCTGSDYGGGVHLDWSSACIRGNVIRDNSAGSGGGIFCQGARDAIIRNNEVFNNTSDLGAGIRMNAGWLEVTRNAVYNNVGEGEWAAGIYASAWEARVINNTVVGNPHGIIVIASNANCRVINNIVTENAGVGVIFDNAPFPGYNNVWSNGSLDVRYNRKGISEDPRFVDAANGDFTLLPYSPCIDRGDPDTLYTDADGTRNDMGAIPHTYTLPVAVDLTLPDERQDRVVDHTPEFMWKFHDTVANEQQAFQLEVRSSIADFTADMWSTGVTTGPDTLVEYSGNPLVDGNTYYLRLRLEGNSGWGDWVYSSLRTNRPPGAPQPLSPIDQQEVGAEAVQLIVDSAANSEGDTITYDFEIYESYNDTVPLMSLTGYGKPTSKFFTGLDTGRVYLWRARSFDRYEHSSWTSLESFVTRGSITLRVPDNYATIQAAIDAASFGDTILVAPGIYQGEGNRDLQFHDQVIRLESTARGAAVIDCQGSAAEPHRAFYFPHSKYTNHEIIGFKVTNGYADVGGAAYGYQASPIFRDCIFQSNQASIKGGALGGYSFGPTLIDCELIENTAPYGGAVSELSGMIEGCSFLRNSADAGGAVDRCGNMSNCYFEANSANDYGSAIHGGYYFYIDGCTFVDHNSGYLITSDAASFRHCTFYRNSQISYVSFTGSVVFENCILAYNTGILSHCDWIIDRYGDEFIYVSGEAVLLNCLLYGNTYEYSGCFSDDKGVDGNMLEDPLFCDRYSHDFHLAGASPALGTASDGGDIGAWGYGCFPTDVDEDQPDGLPTSFQLYQSYPNPFNPRTTIKFDLPVRSDVTLEVFNILGQRVETLVAENLPAGYQSVSWECNHCATGVYLYRLTAGDFVATKKMILLK